MPRSRATAEPHMISYRREDDGVSWSATTDEGLPITRCMGLTDAQVRARAALALRYRLGDPNRLRGANAHVLSVAVPTRLLHEAGVAYFERYADVAPDTVQAMESVEAAQRALTAAKAHASSLLRRDAISLLERGYRTDDVASMLGVSSTQVDGWQLD